MSKIIEYSTEIMRELAVKVRDYYVSNMTQMLTFETWKANAMTRLCNDPKTFGVQKIDYSKPIRVAPPTDVMLSICNKHKEEFDDIQMNAPIERKEILITDLCRKILQPQLIIEHPNGFTVPSVVSNKDVDVPIWFASTLKSVNVRLGYANMDSATPGALTLGDEVVHAMLGGATGAGKSVALNTAIASLMLEYPPWELDIYLADFKIVELSRYAEPIPAPHVKMVAATESTEFALSLFETLITEMNNRQALFKLTGVQKLADFRKKFDLVVPRVVLIADEFVQMYENIKVAVEKGNDNADELKSLIGNKISAIARLGRSQGLHMLLSSQNMDGSLDEQTLGQFKAGFSLYADTSVSNMLIGNDAAVGIRGKGKGILNMNKGAKNPDDNIMTRVPFIQSEQSLEDSRAGKSTYLQQFLAQQYNMSKDIGFNKGLFYYNEDSVIPYQQFIKDLEFADVFLQHPHQGSDIADAQFRKETAKVIVVGKEVKYSKDPVAVATLMYKKGNNIIVSARAKSDKQYMLQLLARNFSGNSRFDHHVIKANETLFLESQLTDILGDVKIDIQAQATRPNSIINKLKTRKRLLEINRTLADATGSYEWDGYTILQNYIPRSGRQGWYCSDTQFREFLDILEGRSEIKFNTDECDEWIKANNGKDVLDVILDGATNFGRFKLAYMNIIGDNPRQLSGADFKPCIIWIFGADEIPDMLGYDNKPVWAYLLSEGPTVGYFSILTADNWSKIGEYAEHCNMTWDKEDKAFFMDVGLPKRININPNSFQITSRDTRSSRIIRQYNIG